MMISQLSHGILTLTQTYYWPFFVFWNFYVLLHEVHCNKQDSLGDRNVGDIGMTLWAREEDRAEPGVKL